MKKTSKTSRNAVAKLFKPIGGMCNTISGEYIKDNQACSISGVIYNEDINSFHGSYIYDNISSYNDYVFYKLFNVEYKSRQCLFATYNGGIYNITENKAYPIESNVVPSHIIFNQDGLFISSSYNVYHLKNTGEKEKITFSISPFAWQRISPRQSPNLPTNSLFYHNGRLYFSDARGVGYMVENAKEVKILNKSLSNLDFCFCNHQLYAFDYQQIYIISHDEITLYEDISKYNLNVKFTSSFDNELVALYTEDRNYSVICFNVLYKTMKKYKVNLTKGVNTLGFKYIKVINRKFYFLINETDSSMAVIKSSLYEGTFNGIVFNITKPIFENRNSTIYLQNIFYLHESLFCYYAADLKHANAVKNIELYEISNGSLILLDYINPPSNVGSSTNIAINNNRIYAANTYGIFYVDILPDKEYIPCLLTQNGRLCVPQGSSLYFSGVGDFSNWTWGTDIDALFVEIGYKDGGKITYAVVVLDSIIVFKDNGNIYRLSGSYPLWSVSKLGEVDIVTSNALIYGSQIIFGSSSGIKKISATEYYGDFFLSDYQFNMQDKNVQSVSLCSSRNNIIFVSQDYIFEYSNILKGFYIYENNKNNKFIQVIEIFNPDKTYNTYALNSSGRLFMQNKNKLNNVEVIYKEIKSNLNMVIKAVVVYTPLLNEEKSFNLIINGDTYKLQLKANKNRHKYFITKKVNKLQIKLTHKGDFFIDNIFIEYAQIGE